MPTLVPSGLAAIAMQIERRKQNDGLCYNFLVKSEMRYSTLRYSPLIITCFIFHLGKDFKPSAWEDSGAVLLDAGVPNSCVDVAAVTVVAEAGG